MFRRLMIPTDISGAQVPRSEQRDFIICALTLKKKSVLCYFYHLGFCKFPNLNVITAHPGMMVQCSSRSWWGGKRRGELRIENKGEGKESRGGQRAGREKATKVFHITIRQGPWQEHTWTWRNPQHL